MNVRSVDDVGRMLYQMPVKFFAFPQRLLSPFPLRHIDEE